MRCLEWNADRKKGLGQAQNTSGLIEKHGPGLKVLNRALLHETHHEAVTSQQSDLLDASEGLEQLLELFFFSSLGNVSNV